ncbi:MAG: hypothetical protein GY699_11605, partial [Desulfobacteraceae bacterium]|nr:hypothetical protein [Desulfobacteraceae bacterium]
MKKITGIFLFCFFLIAIIFINSQAETDKRDFDADGDVDAADLIEFSQKYGATIWYKDSDGDGYSDGTTQYSNLQPDNFFSDQSLVEIAGDCNDGNILIHPEAVEDCDDGIDNNCDGNTDFNDTACIIPCTDNDGDNYGVGPDCIDFDCDDGNPSINPGATEECDGLDNDCDGATDEGIQPQPCAYQTGVCNGASITCSNGEIQVCDEDIYSNHSDNYQVNETL